MNPTAFAGVVSLLVLALDARASVAALLTMTGAEAGVWADNAVVYAEVSSVKDVGLARAQVTLRVLATLTGAYDAAANPMLETELYYGGKVSAIRERPSPAARAVVVVRRLPDGRYNVPPDIVTFMHNAAAILEVQGFGDPAVAKTIERLREVRRMKPGPESRLQLLKEARRRHEEERRGR